jgi:hypothetical protein
MTLPDLTHRLQGDHALCGDAAPLLSPHDAAVNCPTCRALIALAERRRRNLVLRYVVVIGKMASA